MSYMQLIEVAVVAAFREAGVTLARIREAREYIKTQVESEYPFSDYKFKTDGKSLLMDYAQLEGKNGRGKLLELNKKGQLAWSSVLDARLQEFEYDKEEGLVLRWHLAGIDSSVVIDPRISFGTPTVKGTPTWAIKGRWEAGDQIEEIADDFRLSGELVCQALDFEQVKHGAQKTWVS